MIVVKIHRIAIPGNVDAPDRVETYVLPYILQVAPQAELERSNNVWRLRTPIFQTEAAVKVLTDRFKCKVTEEKTEVADRLGMEIAEDKEKRVAFFMRNIWDQMEGLFEKMQKDGIRNRDINCIEIYGHNPSLPVQTIAKGTVHLCFRHQGTTKTLPSAYIREYNTLFLTAWDTLLWELPDLAVITTVPFLSNSADVKTGITCTLVSDTHPLSEYRPAK